MWTAYAAKLAGKSGNQPSRSFPATDETRNESRLSRSFALPVGRPSSAVALLRRVEARSRAPSSGKLANRGGEFRPHPGPLPQERGLPFPPAGHRFSSSPFLAHPSADDRHRPGAEPGKCRGASANAGRTIRLRQPFLPLLGERAGVRAELSTGFRPLQPIPIILWDIVGARSAGVRAELASSLVHLRLSRHSVFHQCFIRGQFSLPDSCLL